MKLKKTITKTTIALAMAGVIGAGSFGVYGGLVPVQQAGAAAVSQSDSQKALQTLNSFYKPALNGHFPGVVSSFVVGKTTKDEVIKAIGKAPMPAKDADSFDVYGAEMGNPGYAFNYKLGKIREIRYFGTNVERQTNIGGITIAMVKKNWYAPSSVSTIKTGKITQTKLTYVRGAYKLEFIFNSSTDLDHINLTKK
ncbi:YjgB family protein [Paenibacillus physcomitrellae]|uniref:DUF4309 domain-containing protein n=1 Tax=Paenibacillus physcomitrellae TaxID=1619311 RepID=A0ABQ1FUH3_9BACL|nr:YjgB family protein [Paenibacillus physcomitrellae]GGA30146.1 hypothetical protein GCM10010917_14070 [Paenibacillus physcomitrellae]